MKKLVKKYIGVILILLIATLSFSGCDDSAFHAHIFKQKMNETEHFLECRCGKIVSSEEHKFEWKSDYRHKECTACGYTIKDNTPIVIEKNEDGTIKLKDELILSLTEYFSEFHLHCDRVSLSFADKLDRCKNDFDPLLVKFSDECYYVAAYYEETHEDRDERVSFCCASEYIWVGFERAEDVKNNWCGKELMGAFQINPGEFCVNIKTGSNDVIMEHFAFYKPEFVDGVALAPEIVFDNFFIYLNWELETDKYIAYSSTNSALHEINSLRCIELEGKYYVIQYHSTDWGGSRDLEQEYGDYYNLLMIILVDEYPINENNKTKNYGLYKMEHIVKIINRR